MNSFVMALQSLTRLKVKNLVWDEVRHGKSTAYFSLVGLIIGVLLWGAIQIVGSYYPAIVVSALIIALEFYLTGGMHLDGFMDSMDGLFSGRPRERILEIMRDSRVGAYGAMTVIILLLIKFSLIFALPSSKSNILMLMPAVSRWTVVYCIKVFPYARSEGMGKAYHQYTGTKELLINGIVIVAAGYALLKLPGLALIGLLTLLVHLIWSRVADKLGGLTGDTYGAIIESTEVLTLLIFYLL